jgi:putative SOS response-associated peptidase YedK
MCGRYASTRSSADLAALFEAYDETEGEVTADYNVAPTDPVPIVRMPSGPRTGPDGDARTTARVLTVARWGLVLAWSLDTSGAARMINARAETVSTSRAFGVPFAQRRCLVPADGWYEWVRTGGAKQPYFMTRADGGVLAFGGVWTAWGQDDARRLTFSVLTRPAVGDLALVHDRMPLVLPPRWWEEWLTAPDPTGLLTAPFPEYAAGIELRPVGMAVGDVRNDGPDLIRAVPAPPLGQSTVEPEDLTLF